MDLGSVTNVMEEPAVELPLLTDPWSYQVDILVLSMDLTAGKTWDQSTRRRR
jgi:hypothetical protein